jgi:hypothetical protein
MKILTASRASADVRHEQEWEARMSLSALPFAGLASDHSCVAMADHVLLA